MKVYYSMLICLAIACNSSRFDVNTDVVYKKLLNQRQAFMLDRRQERIDTISNLVEIIRNTNSKEYKIQAEQIMLSALLATCDFEGVKQFLEKMNKDAFEYSVQKQVYMNYASAKSNSEKSNFHYKYAAATCENYLIQNQESLIAATDLMMIKHSYYSKAQLIVYTDSLSHFINNVIINDYDGSNYEEYRLIVECEVPAVPEPLRPKY